MTSILSLPSGPWSIRACAERFSLLEDRLELASLDVSKGLTRSRHRCGEGGGAVEIDPHLHPGPCRRRGIADRKQFIPHIDVEIAANPNGRLHPNVSVAVLPIRRQGDP